MFRITFEACEVTILTCCTVRFVNSLVTKAIKYYIQKNGYDTTSCDTRFQKNLRPSWEVCIELRCCQWNHGYTNTNCYKHQIVVTVKANFTKGTNTTGNNHTKHCALVLAGGSERFTSKVVLSMLMRKTPLKSILTLEQKFSSPKLVSKIKLSFISFALLSP